MSFWAVTGGLKGCFSLKKIIFSYFCVSFCNFGLFLLFCHFMYKFLKGRLMAVRLTLLAATLTLVVIGIATIYSVGCPAQRRPILHSDSGGRTNRLCKQNCGQSLEKTGPIRCHRYSWIHSRQLRQLPPIRGSQRLDIRLCADALGRLAPR